DGRNVEGPQRRHRVIATGDRPHVRIDRRIADARDVRTAPAETLVLELLRGGDGGAAGQDAKGQVGCTLQGDGQDPPTLASAVQTDPRPIDLRLALEETGCGHRVVRIDGQVLAARGLTG